MTDLEGLAWKMYCAETAGSMDVRDFWEELPERVQAYYLKSAAAVVKRGAEIVKAKEEAIKRTLFTTEDWT